MQENEPGQGSEVGVSMTGAVVSARTDLEGKIGGVEEERFG